MNVLSPIWLIGLAPWLALAVWMFRGGGKTQRVPFLRLWGGTNAAPKASRKRELPPFAMIAMLIALLLGVVAASRIAIGKRQRITVNLIVDRGTRMSAGGAVPRFISRTNEVLDHIQNRWPNARVNLVPLPGTAQLDLSIEACRSAVRDLSITANDTIELLARATHARQPNTIVVSNQAGDSFNDIGIVSLVLATQPHLQLMLRLQNFSTEKSVILRIKTAGMTVDRVLPLPSRGSTSNAFVDLDRVGDVIVVSLVGNNDDNPVNNDAYLTRESEQRAPEPRIPLSPAQQRVIDVYQRKRVRQSTAETLPIVDGLESLMAADAGIIVPKLNGSIPLGLLKVSTHPVTDHVDWQSLPKSLQIAEAPEGWTPLVSIDSHACIAINPQHPRQVWIGIELESWSTTKDFVIFWTNVLDYAGGGSEKWLAYPITGWTTEWTLRSHEAGVALGVYHRADGATRAFNASEISAQPVLQEPWQLQLNWVKPEPTAGEIAPALLLAALGMIVLFAIRY